MVSGKLLYKSFNIVSLHLMYFLLLLDIGFLIQNMFQFHVLSLLFVVPSRVFDIKEVEVVEYHPIRGIDGPQNSELGKHYAT